MNNRGFTAAQLAIGHTKRLLGKLEAKVGYGWAGDILLYVSVLLYLHGARVSVLAIMLKGNTACKTTFCQRICLIFSRFIVDLNMFGTYNGCNLTGKRDRGMTSLYCFLDNESQP